MSSRKIKPPLKYISHSQFWLFNNNPAEYYQQYYIARVDQPTDKMIFGKIFQEAWSDPKYDYKTELKKAGFTPSKELVIERALQHPDTKRLPVSKTEKKVYAKGLGLNYQIMGILDGFSDGEIIENKTGKVWSKKMVDESDQITWYSLLVYIKYGYMPKFRLQSFNSNNGMPTIYVGKRKVGQLKELVKRINSMVARIEAGDFNNY